MNNQRTEDEKKRRRRALWIVMLTLAAAALVTTGILIAYFSDVISKSGTVQSGTLDITGTYAFYLNGTAAGEEVNNLNPGDVLVVKARVTNTGNKSAWVRNVVSFTNVDAAIQPYLRVFIGEYTLADIAAGTADDDEIDVTGAVAASDNMVLNGTGAGAETESGGTFTYIGSNAFDAAMTIYFDSLADNTAQGKTFSFTAMTQALQFRNNNAAEPTDTAWNTVVTIPYGG